MKKIKILKDFPTTHFGYLNRGQIIECHDGFADYVVDRMEAGEIVKATRKKPIKKVNK